MANDMAMKHGSRSNSVRGTAKIGVECAAGDGDGEGYREDGEC